MSAKAKPAPGATGFDLLERIERVPLLVFTLQRVCSSRFEVNACEYLRKPNRGKAKKTVVTQP